MCYKSGHWTLGQWQVHWTQCYLIHGDVIVTTVMFTIFLFCCPCFLVIPPFSLLFLLFSLFFIIPFFYPFLYYSFLLSFSFVMYFIYDILRRHTSITDVIEQQDHSVSELWSSCVKVIQPHLHWPSIPSFYSSCKVFLFNLFCC